MAMVVADSGCITISIYRTQLGDLDQANQIKNEPVILRITIIPLCTPFSPQPRGVMSFEPRRRYFYTACVCIVAVSIVGLLATALRTLGQSPLYPLISQEKEAEIPESSQTCSQVPIHSDPISYLNGPPTDRFRGLLYRLKFLLMLKTYQTTYGPA